MGSNSIDIATLKIEPLEWPNTLELHAAYTLGAERMRAAIIAVIFSAIPTEEEIKL